MASTNKTTNLGLNQWVLSDPFLMEDMNADNQKIDEAVCANPYEKLISVITTANALQVDFDLSDIDLTKYAALKIEACFACTPTGAVAFPFIRINNLSDTVYYHTADDQGAAGNRTYFFAVSGSFDTAVPACFRAELSGISGAPGTTAGSKYIMGECLSFGYLSGNKCLFAEKAVLSLANEISSINLLTNTASGYFQAGSEFTLYGVKK